MYFYTDRKKQIVDFTGDFILTHNTGLVTARFPSAAPKGCKNGDYIIEVYKLGFIDKCKAVYACVRFIWGPNTALTPESIEANNAGS